MSDDPSVVAARLRVFLKTQGIRVVSIGYDTRPDFKMLFAYVFEKADIDRLPNEYQGFKVVGRKIALRPYGGDWF